MLWKKYATLRPYIDNCKQIPVQGFLLVTINLVAQHGSIPTKLHFIV